MVTGLIVGLMLHLVQPAHPMHTSAADLQDSGSGMVSIRIRVFEDDFMAVLSDRAPGQPADSVMSRYVRGRFALTDRTGRRLSVQWLAFERTGAVLLLRLAANVPGGLAGAGIINAILCDRFDDQVNIVRASYAGRTTTLLFTPGDGAKALP